MYSDLDRHLMTLLIFHWCPVQDFASNASAPLQSRTGELFSFWRSVLDYLGIFVYLPDTLGTISEFDYTKLSGIRHLASILELPTFWEKGGQMFRNDFLNILTVLLCHTIFELIQDTGGSSEADVDVNGWFHDREGPNPSVSSSQ